MSDTSQGPGWWQASDGKWYPPEQAPGGQAAAGGTGGGAQDGVDVGSALSYGWNKFVANIGDIIVIWLIVIVVQVMFNFLGRTTSSLVMSLVLTGLGVIVGAIVQIGLLRVGLLITAGQKPTVEAAFSTENIAPYIIASLLYGVAVFLGFFALCIGAIVVSFLFWFYGYYVLDQNQDPVTSLKSSMSLTTSNFGTVGVFAIVAFLINLFTCGLGAPVVQIATAYMYRKLNGQPVAP